MTVDVRNGSNIVRVCWGMVTLSLIYKHSPLKRQDRTSFIKQITTRSLSVYMHKQVTIRL